MAPCWTARHGSTRRCSPANRTRCRARAGAPVIAGSHNLSAAVQVRVERLGADTRFAGIVALMEQAAVNKPQLAKLVDRLARRSCWRCLAIAGLAGVVWWQIDPGRALMVAVAVLIVTCPCALSLATPAAMLASAGALARRGVLVRDLQALEALAGVDTVVFDKTGTLTEDGMARGRHPCARRAGVRRCAGHGRCAGPPLAAPGVAGAGCGAAGPGC